MMTLLESLPTFTTSATLDQYRESFDSVQCVCFKQVDGIRSSSSSTGPKKRKRTRKHKHKQRKATTDHDTRYDSKALSYQRDLLNTFKSATRKDQDSWTVENGVTVDPPSSTSPSDFLSPSATQNGYCSFVLQDNSNQTLSNFGKYHVQHSSLPLIAHNESQKKRIDDAICIANPYWIFVGRNSTEQNMKGRNEHIDDIEHNGGTFHYQVTGTKIWTVRPTDELRAMCDGVDIALKGSYIHVVEEGDIFVINTRLWWHQTEIPGRTTRSDDDNGNKGGMGNGYCNLSVSYARDIYLDGTKPLNPHTRMHMSNKDGAWATAFIPEGTVLLTEADPPICRTSNRIGANCRLVVVGDENEGEEQLALVTLRDIKEGEDYVMFESENDL
jgi:hypothetical protein